MSDHVSAYVPSIATTSDLTTSFTTEPTTAEPLERAISWMRTAENVWLSG